MSSSIQAQDWDTSKGRESGWDGQKAKENILCFLLLPQVVCHVSEFNSVQQAYTAPLYVPGTRDKEN